MFASCFPYEMHRRIGSVQWSEWVKDAFARGDDCPVPGMRTLMQAAHVEETQVALYVSAGLAKERSRAAGDFLASSHDVWLSVDDDVYASSDVIWRMAELVRGTRRVIAAPYWLRGDGQHLSLRWDDAPRGWSNMNGWLVAPNLFFGFGLVVASRLAIESMTCAFWPNLIVGGRGYPHDEGVFPALFSELIRGGGWLGEDYSFCERARMSPCVWLGFLPDAPVWHAGRWCEVKIVGNDLQALWRTDAEHPA